MAVLEKEKMIDSALAAVKTALARGASEAEAFVYDGQATSIGIERGQITKGNRIIDRGIGVRVTLNNAMGFAYTNIIENKSAVEDTISRAISAARASKPDKDWKGFPDSKPFAPVEKTYDQQIFELRSEDLVDVASRMMDAAVAVNKKVFPIEGGSGAAYVSNAIANSNGITGFDRGTMIECSLATIAQEGTKVTPVCYEFNSARTYDIAPEWVGKEAARLAVSALKTKQIETKTTKLVLTQFALQDLLYYTLMNAVKADSVQRGQSTLKDKIGAKIGSDSITIQDDGLFPGGLHSGMFDGEGVPHKKTMLVEKGVLRNFLYDSYAAKKEGKESTGNASRAGYLSTPSIDATNFHILPGNISADNLLDGVDDGLIAYYLQGAHSSNPVSGDFSVVATPAWKIRKGEMIHSTRGVMLAGNIFDLLKNVTTVANNDRKMGQLISPWILVENVRIIGK